MADSEALLPEKRLEESGNWIIYTRLQRIMLATDIQKDGLRSGINRSHFQS